VKVENAVATYDPASPAPAPASDLSPGLQLAAESLGTSQAAAIARETGKIQAAFVMARHHPRQEAEAVQAIGKACANVRLADEALWSFPRGGKTLSGPSIHLARAAAVCWKNISFGFDVEGRDEDFINLSAYAIDCEANVHARASQRVRRLIQRKVYVNGEKRTEWVQPDERDELELVNRVGSKLVRRCIFEVVPSWFIRLGEERAKATMKAGLKNAKTRDDRIRTALILFADLAVTPDMITRKFDSQVAELTADQIAELLAIYQSMSSGELSREQAFPVEASESKIVDPEAEAKATVELEDIMSEEEAAADVERTKAETTPATRSDGAPPDGPYAGISTEDLRVEQARLEQGIVNGNAADSKRLKGERASVLVELERREGAPVAEPAEEPEEPAPKAKAKAKAKPAGPKLVEPDPTPEDEEPEDEEAPSDPSAEASPFGSRDEMFAELPTFLEDEKIAGAARAIINSFCKSRKIKKVRDLEDQALAALLGKLHDLKSVSE